MAHLRPPVRHRRGPSSTCPCWPGEQFAFPEVFTGRSLQRQFRPLRCSRAPAQRLCRPNAHPGADPRTANAWRLGRSDQRFIRARPGAFQSARGAYWSLCEHISFYGQRGGGCIEQGPLLMRTPRERRQESAMDGSLALFLPAGAILMLTIGSTWAAVLLFLCGEGIAFRAGCNLFKAVELADPQSRWFRVARLLLDSDDRPPLGPEK